MERNVMNVMESLEHENIKLTRMAQRDCYIYHRIVFIIIYYNNKEIHI